MDGFVFPDRVASVRFADEPPARSEVGIEP